MTNEKRDEINKVHFLIVKAKADIHNIKERGCHFIGFGFNSDYKIKGGDESDCFERTETVNVCEDDEIIELVRDLLLKKTTEKLTELENKYKEL
jgi:hypothetical protein